MAIFIDEGFTGFDMSGYEIPAQTVTTKLEKLSREYVEETSPLLKTATLDSFVHGNARWFIGKLFETLHDNTRIDSYAEKTEFNHAKALIAAFNTVLKKAEIGRVIDMYLDGWISRGDTGALDEVVYLWAMIQHPNKLKWAEKMLMYRDRWTANFFGNLITKMLKSNEVEQHSLLRKFFRSATVEWISRAGACSDGREWCRMHLKSDRMYDLIDLYHLECPTGHMEFVVQHTCIYCDPHYCDDCEKVIDECKCDFCDACGSVRCECRHCDCGEILDDDSCSNCGQCESCCTCYYCDGCNESIDPNYISQCENCGKCKECCECFTCSECDETYDEHDHKQCEECELCHDCCECEKCPECNDSWERCECSTWTAAESGEQLEITYVEPIEIHICAKLHLVELDSVFHISREAWSFHMNYELRSTLSDLILDGNETAAKTVFPDYMWDAEGFIRRMDTYNLRTSTAITPGVNYAH